MMYQIATHLDSPSLLCLSKISKLYHHTLINYVNPNECIRLWKQARQQLGLYGLLASWEGLQGEVKLANLIWGSRRCMVSHAQVSPG